MSERNGVEIDYYQGCRRVSLYLAKLEKLFNALHKIFQDHKKLFIFGKILVIKKEKRFIFR